MSVMFVCGGVLDEITSALFKEKFLDDIFGYKGCLLPYASLKALFDKVVHSSIMKLSVSSMDKLFDLMIMAVKYQIMQCRNPSLILNLTYNHLNELTKLVSKNVALSVDAAKARFSQAYGNASLKWWSETRRVFANYLLGKTTRISTLLRDGCQKEDGKMVYPRIYYLSEGQKKPGEFTIFAADGTLITVEQFHYGGEFLDSRHSSGFFCNLGLNRYKQDPDEEHEAASTVSSASNVSEGGRQKLEHYRQKIQLLLDDEFISEDSSQTTLLDLMDALP